MAWSLKGSYAETCSCELMCPCNLSFDHGAGLPEACSHRRTNRSGAKA